MEQMNAFDCVGGGSAVSASAGFKFYFPELVKEFNELADEYGKFVEKYGEVQSLRDMRPAKLQALNRYYEYASKVTDKLLSKTEGRNIPKQIALTEENKNEILKRLNDYCVKDGLVGEFKGSLECQISGKHGKKGDIFLVEMDGSSNAISLECCTLNNYVEIGKFELVRLA